MNVSLRFNALKSRKKDTIPPPAPRKTIHFQMLSILLRLVADFFAGAFLCNAIPHLASGLRGEPFPSPFARPPGQGLSSPVVNFVWGYLNLVICLALLSIARIEIGLNSPLILFLLGFLLLGLMDAYHFGKVRSGR